MNAVGLVLIIFLVALGHSFGVKRYWQSVYLKIPAPILGMAYAVFLNFCLFMAPPAGKPFIYFQF
jgi:alginate O-acetyltransferase complex protein AlgI